MTKEELKQEAQEWLCNNLHSASEEDFIKAMVDIAEPREKRITELENTNKRISVECHKLVDSLEKMQNKNVELIGKVGFLENDLNNAKAQIEKMKCCFNCKHSRTEYEHCMTNKHEKWEIKEK